MKNSNHQLIPIYDIYTAAFLKFHGIEPSYTAHRVRVVFEFEPSETVYRLLRQYQENPPVNVLEYVAVLREVRSKMLQARNH